MEETGWGSTSIAVSRTCSGPSAPWRTGWTTLDVSYLASAQKPEMTTAPPLLRQCSAHHSFHGDNYWIPLNNLQKTFLSNFLRHWVLSNTLPLVTTSPLPASRRRSCQMTWPMPTGHVPPLQPLYAANFSLPRRWNLHDKGGIMVTMWCSTSPYGCRSSTLELELLTTVGMSANSFSKLSALTLGVAGAKEAVEWWPVTVGRATQSTADVGDGEDVAVSDNHHSQKTAGWPCRLACLLQGPPSVENVWEMGDDTAARRKLQVKRRPCSDKDIVISPQHGMSWPAAPLRPEGGDEDWWGKIELLSPVSTKKRLLDSWSTKWTREPRMTTVPRRLFIPALQ